MAKKRRLKSKFRRLLKRIRNLFFLLLIIYIIYMFFNILFPNNYIESITINDNILDIKLNSNKELYCILSNYEPDLDNINWVKAEDQICRLNYKNHSNLYIKNNKKIVYKTNKDLYIEFNNKDTIYLPLNDKYDFYKYIIGNTNKLDIDISNERIFDINENGNINPKKEGESTLEIEYNDIVIKSKIIVTNLITKRPDSYDFKKEYLSCNKYSEKENNLLDELLKSRINEVGYKTRAGAVEAARFLTLDFPYRINYFNENGRQTTNNVDGEGRYYHEGFYLHDSRFDNITGSATGPKTWGCSLFSNPKDKFMDNGLDCSGFVSWTLLNAGFDVKDVGAGWSDKLDLTDYGEVKKLTDDLQISDTVKVGDLLHSEAAGGHIGIIVGIDKDYYYVAQALWYDEIGVIITKYKKNKLNKSFPHVVLMDKYYINDGNLTNMW